MFKRLLPAVMMIVGIFMLTACANDESTSKESSNADETKFVLPDPELRNGASGKKVTELKQVLSELGYSLPESDTFDDDTTMALKDFQSQQVKLAATGIYDADTKQWLERALDGSFTINPGKGLSQDAVNADSNKTITVSNPKDTLVLVNKHHALPADYEPDDLVIPDVRFPFTEDIPKKYMRKEAADALEELFATGDAAGVNLFGQSGYRSHDRQKSVFDAYVAKDGKAAANKYSARPGESEHQTGLTMDVTSPDINYDIVEDFADTNEGKWLKDNAHKYGFIIRYPKDKVDITEYQYEPWHIRYVGKDAAKVIYEKHITLEEYLGAV
ncbi:D-alanyl-D-alanine carboxypeptidase family protein [Lentibacillus sp. L22]|uniref:M15 family metallopeptidase n=1 Tax=Lentibacillus TaxID=175304 RepID=UPI0022B15F81|nr:D-alanyl-D-alanine carboxypeptidase family protein [Lentibacillus daqui]